MRQITYLAVPALAIGLVAGCAWNMNTLPANPPPPTYCSSATCNISVTVALTIPSLKCTITIDPLLLDVSKGPATQTITWTLAGAVWPADKTKLPIKFGSNADGVMSAPVVSGPAVSVTYTRPPKGGNVYGYGVTALAAASQICSTDPWVQD